MELTKMADQLEKKNTYMHYFKTEEVQKQEEEEERRRQRVSSFTLTDQVPV